MTPCLRLLNPLGWLLGSEALLLLLLPLPFGMAVRPSIRSNKRSGLGLCRVVVAVDCPLLLLLLLLGMVLLLLLSCMPPLLLLLQRSTG